MIGTATGHQPRQQGLQGKHNRWYVSIASLGIRRLQMGDQPCSCILLLYCVVTRVDLSDQVMAKRLLRRVWVQGFASGNFSEADALSLANLVESLLKVIPWNAGGFEGVCRRRMGPGAAVNEGRIGSRWTRFLGFAMDSDVQVHEALHVQDHSICASFCG